jgi:lipoate-protein ligase A
VPVQEARWRAIIGRRRPSYSQKARSGIGKRLPPAYPPGMEFHVLPMRTGAAAENMAVDFLLLRRSPAPPAIRFRHYEWRNPAFTFGFGQKVAWVREQLPPGERFDICRRPTGGGIVDHRQDWTYTLVIPREHELWEERVAATYRIVHDCLAQVLRELGQPAIVKEPVESAETTGPGGLGQMLTASLEPGVCFQRAELYDVIHQRTGEKIAGAAQKRNKQGLLFQGSIWKPAVGLRDWENFGARFAIALAGAAGVPARAAPWPDLNEDELTGLTEQYSAPEWIDYR